MRYNIVVFGVKDTTSEIVEYIANNLCAVDYIVTINKSVLENNHVSGFSDLSSVSKKHGIGVFESGSYSLKDKICHDFFENNSFDIGISMGWQRLIPGYILKRFNYGVFGFHGSCGYLPYGRGRSPLNWSIINDDHRFILNLFRYDEKADSQNVFENKMFEINQFDTIRTLQYKQLIYSKIMVKDLIKAYQSGAIRVKTESKDFDTWYEKRGVEDGKIDFKRKTIEIYNLVRGVSKPFPGAFAYINSGKIIIWEAYPFDGIMDFSHYSPGEVIDVFDHNLIVRTIDGSLIINEYEYNGNIIRGDIMV
jgi:UDP-4-amino-4-deoxy-L-arabinose formyltransferase/UDP-glucuronic acid dehydrogenase (UDP-4-keto-hexauronic acid decarboxylating)